MATSVTNQPRRMPLARSAVSRTARLFIVGFIGWLWFSPACDSAWGPVSLVAVTALAAVVGIAWYLFRARAERRLSTAMDRYAELELEKGTHPRRDSHAHPQSQGRRTADGAGL